MCERFDDYLIGRHFHTETDNRPLVSFLKQKTLSDLPARIARFQMRLMLFSYTIAYVPGKLLCTADALSRAPLSLSSTIIDSNLDSVEVERFAHSVLQGVPATPKRLEEILVAQVAN